MISLALVTRSDMYICIFRRWAEHRIVIIRRYVEGGARAAEGGLGLSLPPSSTGAPNCAGQGLVDCGDCPDGQYVVDACDEDGGTDRTCSPCSDRCGTDVTDCKSDGNGDALCAECNFEGMDIFINDEDGDGYGECKFCSPCRDGYYLQTPCSAFEDNRCERCRCWPLSVQGLGQGRSWAAGTLPGSKLQQTQLPVDSSSSSSPSLDLSCGPFISPFLPSPSARLPALLPPTYQASHLFVVMAYEICHMLFCLRRECGDGEVEVSSCSASQDAVCEVREEQFEQQGEEEEERESQEQEQESESEAVECGECPGGHFLVKECDEDDGRDRECKPCSDRCGEGVTECVAVGGGEAHCKECNFGDGFYNEDRDGDGYGECKFCSPCRSGRYLKTSCSAYEDNECELCR